MNFKRLSIVFTLFYIACEIVYNLGLVEFLSSANTEVDVYERLEFFGKLLASIGLSLFVVKLIPFKKVASFFVFLPLVFFTQTFAFNFLIDNLTPQVRMKAYVGGLYRNGGLNQVFKGELFNDKSSYGKVLLANIGFLSNEKEQTGFAKSILTVEVDESVFADHYTNYKQLYEKFDNYWATYLIQNKRWSGHDSRIQARIDEKFKEKSGGFSRGLSKSDFYSQLGQKSASYRTYMDMVIIPGNKALGLVEVKGRDIPAGMNQEQFNKFFQSKISKIKESTALTEGNVKNLPHSRQLVASVVIPPIAITLSLLSIVLNSAVVLASVFRPMALIPVVAMVAGAFVGYTNPYGLNPLVSRLVLVESRLHQALAPVAEQIKAVSIDDKHPNESKIVRIKKPEPLNFSDLDEKFASLNSADIPEIPKEYEGMTGDIERLEKDKSYFGEVRKEGSKNPYTNKDY